MELQVGKYYIWNGKTAKLTSKWAQGKWYTYTFDDGRHFNGDPQPMFVSGELKDTGAAKSIVPVPNLLPKKDGTSGKTSKS